MTAARERASRTWRSASMVVVGKRSITRADGLTIDDDRFGDGVTAWGVDGGEAVHAGHHRGELVGGRSDDGAVGVQYDQGGSAARRH